MKQLMSNGSQKLAELITKSAEVKKKIDSDSQLLSTQGPSKETMQEKRLREFLTSECSWEGLDSWSIYLKEKSQNAANSKKKKV